MTIIFAIGSNAFLLREWSLGLAVIAGVALLVAVASFLKGAPRILLWSSLAGLFGFAVVAASSVVVPSTVWPTILVAARTGSPTEVAARRRELAGAWDAFHGEMLVTDWLVLSRSWGVCHELWPQTGCTRAPGNREAQGIARDLLGEQAHGG